MRRLIAVATVALLGLAACGDDSTSLATTASSAADTSEADIVANTAVATTAVADTVAETVVENTAVDETVVDVTSPDDPADPNAPGYGSEFCDISNELNESNFDPFEATPEEVEEFFTVSFPDMFGRLVVAAPQELEDDLATVGAAYGLLTTDLKSNGWDMNASFVNPTVKEAMTGDGLSAAGENLDAYCGL